MEVCLYVPCNTDMSTVLAEYPDLVAYEGNAPADETIQYWIGTDEREDEDWLSYDEAIAFCGFCEGAIEGSQAVIEGNGGWAMAMIRGCPSLDRLAMSDAEKAGWQADRDCYREAWERGQEVNRETEEVE